MRPSGKNAIRHGSSKVATVVVLKGRLASGFVSPALTCAHAAIDPRVKSSAAFANFIVHFSLLLKHPANHDPRRRFSSYTTFLRLHRRLLLAVCSFRHALCGGRLPHPLVQYLP